MYSRFSASS
ncbi:hypothetical protein LAV50_03995 [Streptococcus thermophilus]|nr:hypothetical protein [Streptococcus thermophilus]MBZ5811589.1 hypothetical protein [Streptococcus thermophilus]MBZ5822452.1 hypothetical protein [Streptococcus thermophilus]MBZ5824276.1 hypothetical protein [Streptococcus thermophilus]MBZ5834915.1 hypothetical protein [Streptococcus thermophilus]